MRGGKNLTRILKTLPDELQKPVKDTIRENAREVWSAARQAAPVDTGALRDAVKIRFSNKGLRARIGVFRQTKKQRAKGVDTFYAAFVELGTQFRKATPFLFPAFRSRKTQGRAEIAKTAKNALQRQAATRDRT